VFFANLVVKPENKWYPIPRYTYLCKDPGPFFKNF